MNKVGVVLFFFVCMSGVVPLTVLAEPTQYNVTDLGSFAPGYDSYVSGLNNSGQVTGYSYISPTVYHGFVWDPVNGMVDPFNTSVDSRSTAKNINNLGQIVGDMDYDTPNNKYTAVLWDPEILPVSRPKLSMFKVGKIFVIPSLLF
ncbi:MAG: hypothetical protein WCH62_07995, partial [Candidatus Omnitrophota bacterium]